MYKINCIRLIIQYDTAIELAEAYYTTLMLEHKQWILKFIIAVTKSNNLIRTFTEGDLRKKQSQRNREADKRCSNVGSLLIVISEE